MAGIKDWIGIDKAVLFTLLGRGWSVGAGLFTIFMVTKFLSPELQGYYYTFNSLIALQIFVELGLTYVVIQFSSHEMAHLNWKNGGMVSGDAKAKRRLQSLLYFSLTWFGIAAVLMILVLIPSGIYFFNSTKSVETIYETSKPWSLLVIFSSINLIVTVLGAVLEGCGKVADIAVLRFMQSFTSVLAAWLVLWSGGGIYALVANNAILALVGIIWLWFKYRHFFFDLFRINKNTPGMDWRNEVWPFQWRIALSWMSGFLIFQLFNPLLFATHGAVVAGKMGMSLQIIAAMNGAAMAWISTKAPLYGRLVATSQREELDRVALKGFIQSFIFLIIGVIVFGSILYYLSYIGSRYAERVLPLNIFAMLGIVCLANHIVFAQAAYLRAHKQEPFMGISILTGLVTASLAFALVPKLGAAGAVFSYSFSAIIISLIGGTFIFIKKRRQWKILQHRYSKI